MTPHIITGDQLPASERGGAGGRQHAPERHLPAFWRHFLQMLAVMAVGMVATGAIFVFVVGLKSWDQVTLQYPTQALLATAAGMTIPMAAWMLARGMGGRNAAEMAAAMVLPVIPFLCPVWSGVAKSAQCGAYCVLTIVAMLGLMFCRRSQCSGAQSPKPHLRPPALAR
ncbi:MAG TPA: hypothetical protein VFJ07_18320 [Streptosporangiaceae bacterium]|nr:hypothetical protein [Streptosporangiaceae bacterium]